MVLFVTFLAVPIKDNITIIELHCMYIFCLQVTVVSKDSDEWWTVTTASGQFGLVPASYLGEDTHKTKDNNDGSKAMSRETSSAADKQKTSSKAKQRCA
jgi:hypothetical protein